jgi:hypothetical protein
MVTILDHIRHEQQSEFPLYEGRDLWGHIRLVQTDMGLMQEIRKRGTHKWVPFLAMTILNGDLTFALNGPRVRKGVVDGTSCALKNEPA